MEAGSAHFYLTEAKDLSRLREDVRHFFIKYKKDLLEIAAGNKEITNAIHAFENKHWLPYLKKYWNDATKRGHETKIGNIKVMMWGSAGRVLITAERGKEDITMIFSDEQSQTTANGGQQGIHGSQKSALEIIHTLTNTDNIKFEVNTNVRMAGL